MWTCRCLTSKRWRAAPSRFSISNIDLPDNVPLVAFDSSGDARFQELASSDISDSSGELTIEDIKGDLKVRDSSGDIEVEHVSGQCPARRQLG